MRQQTLAGSGFEKFRKKTPKERFLNDIEQIIPWQELCGAIEPYYPKPEGAGRRPVGIECMLSIHFLQHWFDLSDAGAEEVLYDSRAMRTFVGIDLGREPVPDETMISIINAPSSTKNKDKKRDPEMHQMHQMRKGKQYYFGMKAHIGVDSKTKMIHSVVATAANVHDSQVLEDLLHGEETRVWSDPAYTGQKQVLHEHAPNAKDFTQHRGSRYRTLSDEERLRNRNKSRVRSMVEYVFHVMKRQFGFTKVRYRALDKNAHFLFVNCALINLVMAKRRLFRLSQGACA